jgi:hypothetical protein
VSHFLDENNVPQQAARLIFLLRGLGLINFAAVVAVVAPGSWLAASHEILGLGSFPEAPIAGYLARSTSLWFASFGVLLWYLSLDVHRHASVIAFIGWAMSIQGLFMIGIDFNEGLPGWWIAAEGPTCLLLGTALIYLQRTICSKEN